MRIISRPACFTRFLEGSRRFLPTFGQGQTVFDKANMRAHSLSLMSTQKHPSLIFPFLLKPQFTPSSPSPGHLLWLLFYVCLLLNIGPYSPQMNIDMLSGV